jgi:iron(III) transport system permease protein
MTTLDLNTSFPDASPRINWARLAQWALLVLLVLVIVGPVAMVVLEGFHVGGPRDGFQFGLQHWYEALNDRRLGSALWNTFTIVTIRGVIGFVIAIPLAWLIARTNMPGRNALEFGFWIAFFMPSLAYIQGWAFLLDGQRGLLNQWIATLPFIGPALSAKLDVFSYWGIIWVHMMSQNVSTLLVLLVLAFRNIDSSLEEAARISGSSKWRALGNIVVPLSRPMLAMLVVMAYVRGMQSYEVEAILGRPAGIDVYSTLVVQMLASEPPNIPGGAVLSSFILFSLIPLIVLQRMYVGRQQYTTVSGKMRMTQISLGRVTRWVAFAITLTIVALQTIVPFLAVLAGSFMVRWGYFSLASPWTLNRWRDVLTNDQFLACLQNTIIIGLCAGIAAALVCFVIAYVLVRTRFPANNAIDFLSWLPWAVPGVLLSLGLVTFVLGIPALRFLYGSTVILVIAVVLFRFPLSVHLLKSGLLQINKELEEASVICGAGRVRTQLGITIPILSPMLIGVALMVFVTAVNEVSGVVLLASTDVRTLSLLSLDYLLGGSPSREAAAVVTTIMVILCVGVALIARSFGISLGATPPAVGKTPSAA